MALIPGLPRAGSALSCRHGLREVDITSSPWELCAVGWPGKGVRMGSDALELVSAERGKKMDLAICVTWKPAQVFGHC